MSVVVEPEYHWSPDKMVEVVLAEPDDFLKVRETLTMTDIFDHSSPKTSGRTCPQAFLIYNS